MAGTPWPSSTGLLCTACASAAYMCPLTPAVLLAAQQHPECCMPTHFPCGLLPAGVWSALQEIEWTQQAARHCPALHFYVMGFYIHSCPKMTYKARFKPSELLCDRRHCWVPLEVVRGAFDVSTAACQHSLHDGCRSHELLCAACLHRPKKLLISVSCPESLTGSCTAWMAAADSGVLPCNPVLHCMPVCPAGLAAAGATAAHQPPSSEQQLGARLLQAAPYVVLSDAAGGQPAGDGAEARTSAATGAAPCHSQLPAPQQDQQASDNGDDDEPGPSGCPSSSSSSGGQGQPPGNVAGLKLLSTRVLVPAAQAEQQAQLMSFRQYLRSGAQQQVS